MISASDQSLTTTNFWIFYLFYYGDLTFPAKFLMVIYTLDIHVSCLLSTHGSCVFTFQYLHLRSNCRILLIHISIIQFDSYDLVGYACRIGLLKGIGTWFLVSAKSHHKASENGTLCESIVSILLFDTLSPYFDLFSNTTTTNVWANKYYCIV